MPQLSIRLPLRANLRGRTTENTCQKTALLGLEPVGFGALAALGPFAAHGPGSGLVADPDATARRVVDDDDEIVRGGRAFAEFVPPGGVLMIAAGSYDTDVADMFAVHKARMGALEGAAAVVDQN